MKRHLAAIVTAILFVFTWQAFAQQPKPADGGAALTKEQQQAGQRLAQQAQTMQRAYQDALNAALTVQVDRGTAAEVLAALQRAYLQNRLAVAEYEKWEQAVRLAHSCAKCEVSDDFARLNPIKEVAQK